MAAFTYPEPGLKVLSCSNGADGLGFFHKIAVESRDAESIRSSVGDASARTCSIGQCGIGQHGQTVRGAGRTSEVCKAKDADSL